ncbi:hypothetical protein JZK55_09750 [Dissulfurispira thermophila]|uniref:Peptidase C14 caspase domain-containing protein n=1 Tax=Dissulfurispira thermophila TaxID=2715679 RepID=A0A7G1H1N4_9BACT|nr:ankyrin repeat domain-containing protein [Dissulfurispira thermophila]BCB96053.1 hypothetical protein JZK55_09750 [Dissulfurispira thermophila]
MKRIFSFELIILVLMTITYLIPLEAFATEMIPGEVLQEIRKMTVSSDQEIEISTTISRERGIIYVVKYIGDDYVDEIRLAKKGSFVNVVFYDITMPERVYKRGLSQNYQIMDAAKMGDIVGVKELLGKGADVNAKDSNGWTALIWAAMEGKIDVINFLISKGANVYVKDNMGWTALMRAATKGHTSVMELLINKGIDVNAKANDGWTALTEAAWYGHVSAVYLLLNKGADIDYAIIRLESQAIKDPEKTSYYKQAIALLERLRPKKEMVSQQLPSQVAVKQDIHPVIKSDIDELPTIVNKHKIIGDKDIAIIIGIEKYQGLPKSDYSKNDAKLVKDYLKALGFQERNIELITDEKATLSAITKTIEAWLPNRVKPDGRVFVYYSGHGAPEPKTGDAYIVPYDGDPNYLEVTGYPLKRLYAKLGELKAKEVIVALDSCFSGAGGRSVLAKGARPLVIMAAGAVLPSNIVVLSATQGTQISTSSPEKGHGVFTYYFLKALKEGKKTISEIYEHIKPLVEDEAKQLNVQQSPSINPDAEKLKGRFILRR